jgi:hypothetical protein
MNILNILADLSLADLSLGDGKVLLERAVVETSPVS